MTRKDALDFIQRVTVTIFGWTIAIGSLVGIILGIIIILSMPVN